jgi:predicted esterase
MAPFQPLHYLYQAAAGKAVGTLLLLHGTGGDEHDLPLLAAHFGVNFNLLSLRGNARADDGATCFFRHLGRRFFDEADVLFRTHELVAFVQRLSQQQHFDMARLVAVGYSNGAAMAGSLLLLYPELLAGAVLWRPQQPLTRSVPAFTTTRRQPVLFCIGTQDAMVPAAASAHYAALLAAAGFAISWQDSYGGHHLTSHDVHAAAAWLRQHFNAR